MIGVARRAGTTLASCASAALALFPGAAVRMDAHAERGTAEVLCLKDGRIIEGKELARAEGGYEIHFDKGKVFVPEALVLDCVMDEAAGYEPRTQEEKDQLAKGMVSFEGKWILPKKRDELVQRKLAERRKALDDIRAHSEWATRRVETTRHFAFEHTLPVHIFERYRDLMEAYFTEFAKDWKIKPPKDLGPLQVCLYVDRESFQVTGGAGPFVLGYFRFVEPMELNFFHDRLDPAYTEEVMFHETNHYLQKLIDVDFSYPHFPGESLAEYYGASHWDPETRKITTGLTLEGRLSEIQTDLAGGERVGLEKLVATDGMYEHYTWGWSLVHFLMSDPATAKKFQKFVLALPAAKDVRRVAGNGNLKTVEAQEVWSAFQRYMGLETPEQVASMQELWHDYVQRNLKLVTPRGLAVGATAALRTGRPIKAKRLFKEAIEKGCNDPVAFHRYAQLLAGGKEDEEAFALWKRAVELDPLNADFYHSWGLALKRKGKKAEGERLVALALEIDPDARWWDGEIDVSGDDE